MRCVRVPLIGQRVCASHVGYSGKLIDDPVEQIVQLAPEEYPFDNTTPEELEESLFLLEITDAKQFAKAVLESRDFRQYIVFGLRSGKVPPAVMLRLMDYADGWGKPVERVEHTGKDGQPIETVTEVRRVVIRVDARPEPETIDAVVDKPQLTH